MNAATKKRLGLGVLIAAAIVLLLLGLNGRDAKPEVQVVAAVRERLEAVVSSNGKVEPVTPYSVRAQLDTFVKTVRATEGSAVRAGQLILELDAAEAAAEAARLREDLLAAEEEIRAGRSGGDAEARAVLEGDLRKAQADVARLRREFEALERLREKQAASQSELDLKKTELRRAEEELRVLEQKKAEFDRKAGIGAQRGGYQAERARAALASFEEKVRSARVFAPVNGTLYSLPVRAGQFVRVGDLLAEMADLSRVRVRAFVDEPELGLIAEGQEVDILWDAMPTKLWKGRTEIVPKSVVARGTRSVGEVICSVENANLELLPNINVSVRIRVRERADALVVPRAAVHSDGTARHVFVVENGKLRHREVKVGIAGAAKYEILEGLREGERVALPGDFELREGLEIRPVEQK